MRILFITHFFPPKHNAGTENYTAGLAQAFLGRGHQIHVVCAEDWQTGTTYWNGVTEDIYNGVPVQRLHLNWMEASNPNHILYDSPQVERWLDQLLDKIKPDIVHVTSVSSLGVGVLRSAQRAGIPLVLTLMDFWFSCPQIVLMRNDGQLCNGLTTPWECQQCLLASSGLYHKVQRVLPLQLQPAVWQKLSQTPILAGRRGLRGMALNMIERKALVEQGLKLPNIIISHSRFVQQVFSQAGLSQRVVHIPNGHELNWLLPYQGKSQSPVLRFGYMGQIAPTKGIHILIEAFQKANLHGAARLDIWGDLAKDSDYVEKLRSLMGGASSIALRGRFQRDHLAKVLADIDVLAVPSLWYENAPLVIQEAFAIQTPVIATNLGGMAEAVTHEINGLLFERGNADDLARQMRRIVDEPGLLERLQAGVPPVKTIDQEVDELEAIYGKLITQHLPSSDVSISPKTHPQINLV